jgi:hypothetical protein
MSIEQSKPREWPISPSLSATSTPSLTQAPTSIKSILLGRGISDDKADELKDRYNRRSIPIMDDGLFFQLLNQIAMDNDLEEVESKLQSYIDQKSSSLYDDYVTAKHEIGLAGLNLFPTESQQFRFTSGI